ncbi:MAG: (Fe-S)-binding protein [Chloroflexi bacterium]|nr:(Fe-S)-binding protein [Chloroflexota bacterium]
MKRPPAALQRIGDYFREIRLTNDLQTLPEQRTWLARPPRDPEPRKVVLYLGCNVLRTPHMVQVVTGIFDKLSLDYVAVGGPTYCCGAPFLQDSPDDARDLMQRASGYFAEFRPQRVVMWCPGCFHYFQKMLDSKPPYQTQHVTEFLVEHLERMPLRRPIPRRVALHYHNGDAERERQAACARFLLRAVPELELVSIRSDPRLGLQCTARARHTLGSGWDSIITSQFAQALDQGAEVLASLHHSCHRMLVHLQEAHPVQVEHYLSLLGHSLGLDYEDRYRKYMLLADATRILEAARPCLDANHVDLASARTLVHKLFVERTPS